MALTNTFVVIFVVIMLFCGHWFRCKPLVLSVYAAALMGQAAGDYYIQILLFSVALPLLWLSIKPSIKLSIRKLFLTSVDNATRLNLYDLIVMYCGLSLIFLSPIFTYAVIHILYEIVLIGSFYYVIFHSRQVVCRGTWELLATIQIIKITMVEMQFDQLTTFSFALVASTMLVLMKLFKTIKTV